MRIVDINTAPLEDLRLLRGIGLITARRIIANRPYDEASDLVGRGVLGESNYDKNAAFFAVGSRNAGPSAGNGGRDRTVRGCRDGVAARNEPPFTTMWPDRGSAVRRSNEESSRENQRVRS
jgi:hypothetical protein